MIHWRRALPFSLVLGLAFCSGRRDRTDSSRSPGNTMLSAGESLYHAERFDTARAIWTVALRQTRAAHDERAEARALTWLSFVAGRLGDVKEAQGLGEEALAIKTRLGMAAELSESYQALGLAALSDNRNQEAARLFKQGLEAARAAHDVRAEAEGSGRLGLAYTYLGDFQRARAGHRAERLAAMPLGETKLEANGLANEAMVDIYEGDARSAIARLDTARVLYRRVGFASGEQNALGQLATAYELTGEEDQAFAVLDSSLTIARRLGLREEETDLLRLIGALHLRVGDYRTALGYFDQAETGMRQSGLGANLGSVLRSAADAHFRLGDTSRADATLREALRLHTASEEPLEQLDDLLLATEIDYGRGGMPRVEPRLREARTVASRVNTRGARIAMTIAEAHLADLAGDSRRVLRVLRDADAETASGDFGAEWLTRSLAARAHARLGEFDSAAASGRLAVRAVERLRGGLASEALRSTYIADRADVYADLVLVLLRLGRADEAFAVADAARSRGLLEHITAARAAAMPEVVEGERLLRRIDALVRRLRETESSRPRERGGAANPAGAPIAADLAAAQGEYEALLVRSAQRNPRAIALLGAEPARLDAVRAALHSGEVLLEYLVTPKRLIVFAVTSSGMRIIQSDLAGPALAQRVRLIRDLWGTPSPDWPLGLTASRALHQTLIGPLRDAGVLRDARSLFIVPHGILGQAPFAAFQDASTGRFLAQDFAVIHLPSAAALPALRERSATGEDWSGAGTGFAPFPDELPATRKELEAVGASVPRTRLRFRDQATEAAIRRALAEPGLVHVATHGVLNVRHPMFSRIELARPSWTSADDDGSLEIHELLGISIRSSLVFLSGCETGAAQEWTDELVRGAGDLTLAQAILSAGAANVITTLWPIEDAGAADFAAHFYQALRSNSVAGAFAAAQRQMAGDARYGSPYYWAGYVLAGEGRLGQAPQIGGPASVPAMTGTRPVAVVSNRSKP